MTSKRLGQWILALYAVCLVVALIELRTGKPARQPAASLIPSNEAIAVVELFGPISLSMDGLGGGVDVQAVTRQLQDMRDRPDVKAVLLRINSPGGSVAAVQEIHQHVVALRKAGKVVVASFGDVAASGGYYIAAACDQIVANPGTITGSIGVIFQLGNVRELFRKFGVEVETIKSGDMKDAGSPFRPLGEEERRMFRSLVTEAYGQFFRAVAEGRGMKAAELRPLADGRVFTGTQAKDAGLVDVLGNFETAVETAKKLANIRAEKPILIYTSTPWDRLFRWLGSMSAARRLPFQDSASRVRFEYVWE